MFPYENLIIYQKALAVNRLIYRFLNNNNKIERYIKDQFGRASLSIMLNIAEGIGKFSKKERRNYLIIARCSTFECSAIVKFLHGEGEISDQFSNELISACEEISRILYSMIRNLEK